MVDNPDLLPNPPADLVRPDPGDPGRIPAAAPAVPAVPELSTGILAVAIGSSFDTMAGLLGDYWRLSDDEAIQLAKVWKPVLDLYLPTMNGPLKAALIPTVLILGPRMGRYVQRRNREGNTDGRNHGGEGGTGKNDAVTAKVA